MSLRVLEICLDHLDKRISNLSLKTKSNACGSYLTPSNDEKGRDEGDSPLFAHVGQFLKARSLIHCQVHMVRATR